MPTENKQEYSIDKNNVLNFKETSYEKIVIPTSIKEKLYETNWETNDVLVGSLGSLKQLEDNIAKKYYYVPAKHISENQLPVKYIAIAQSPTQFGNNSGIRYYGEVTTTKLLPRKDIKFPMRRNNGDEMYYAFMVSEWKTLPIPIDVRYEAVYKPKFTNIFLLEHCPHSYELFCIRSVEQYILFRELSKLLGSAVNSENPLYESAVQFENGKSVWIHNGCIDLFDHNGNRILENILQISDFSKSPKKVLCLLTESII